MATHAELDALRQQLHEQRARLTHAAESLDAERNADAVAALFEAERNMRLAERSLRRGIEAMRPRP